MAPASVGAAEAVAFAPAEVVAPAVVAEPPAEDEPAEQTLSSGKRVRHDLTFVGARFQ